MENAELLRSILVALAVLATIIGPARLIALHREIEEVLQKAEQLATFLSMAETDIDNLTTDLNRAIVMLDERQASDYKGGPDL